MPVTLDSPPAHADAFELDNDVIASDHCQKINFKMLTVHDDISGMRLCDAYDQFFIDKQAAIPLSIQLLENPRSPIALPGSVNLKGHDHIHLLLNRGVSLFDEGFVVGFTMGNCDRLKPYHVFWYKQFAKSFFPKKYQFNDAHLKAFDFGVMYGQSLPTSNIHQIDFDQYTNVLIRDLRHLFGIDINHIQLLGQAERLLIGPAQ